MCETKREALLKEAIEIVTKNRNAEYGEPEQNFFLISAFWSEYLNIPVSSQDVAIMMALLKIARLKANKSHHDSMVDVAGYMACLAELAE